MCGLIFILLSAIACSTILCCRKSSNAMFTRSLHTVRDTVQKQLQVPSKILINLGHFVVHRWPDSSQRGKKRRKRCKYQKLGGWRKRKRQTSNKKKDKRQDKRNKSIKRRIKSTNQPRGLFQSAEFNCSNEIIMLSDCELATDKHNVMSPNENALLNDPTILQHYSSLIQHHDYSNIKQSEKFELASPVTSLALPIRDTDSELYETHLCINFSEDLNDDTNPSLGRHFRELNYI